MTCNIVRGLSTDSLTRPFKVPHVRRNVGNEHKKLDE